MLMTAVYSDRPAALRYPRGNGFGVTLDETITALPIGKGELLKEGSDLAVVACGTLAIPALKAAEALEAKGLSCAVINARFIKPLDRELILAWAAKAKGVVALEEGVEKGGFSGAIAELLADEGVVKPILRLAVADHLVHHGDQKKLLDEEGLSQARIEASLEGFARRI